MRSAKTVSDSTQRYPIRARRAHESYRRNRLENSRSDPLIRQAKTRALATELLRVRYEVSFLLNTAWSHAPRY